MVNKHTILGTYIACLCPYPLSVHLMQSLYTFLLSTVSKNSHQHMLTYTSDQILL